MEVIRSSNDNPSETQGETR